MQFAPGVLVPPYGVYAARALLPEGEFPAVTNIGVRPTVSSEPVVTVESHLLGFDGNLYGRTLALEFFDFLRPERRFADLDELGAQIAATASVPADRGGAPMNFADIRKKFSGGDRAASADPSRAFGSEAEMMQALRKQEFTPPKPRPTAAEVMGSIRQRFARPAEEMQDRIPRDEAAARTYAPEAMAQPEWENPFTAPEKPRNRAGCAGIRNGRRRYAV